MDWPLRRGRDTASVYSRLLAHSGGVDHGVTTRRGDLRLSSSTERDFDRLLSHRTRACEMFDSGVADCVIPRQVHGNRVAVVRNEDRGRGGWPPDEGPVDSDAVITNVAGILLGITVADCLPVFAYDPVNGAVGLAHSGWRGTVGRIVPTMVAAMGEHYGTYPDRVLVAVGPGICSRCYEVGGDVRSSLLDCGAPADAFNPSATGRWMADLKSVVRHQLTTSGVLAANLSVATWCTSCHNHLFFSHRKEGPTAGRFGAFIRLITVMD